MPVLTDKFAAFHPPERSLPFTSPRDAG